MDEDTVTQQVTVEAKDAAIGQTYLHASQFYRIKVLKKEGEDEKGDVSSVLVESESEPLRPITISGATQLLRYSEELHKPIRTRNHKTRTSNHKKESTMSKKPVAKGTVPRSSIIDRELLRCKGKEAPNWDAIASTVIKAKPAPENKRASIISQAKVRYAWYSKGGKKNPASVNGAGK
jgi:hypothetical protein